MNRILLLPIFMLTVLNATVAQFSIPDSAFAARLNFYVPNAMTGNVLDTNHADVHALTDMSIFGAQIEKLDGIRFFTGLQTLDCTNNYLDSLPELPPALVWLEANNNDLVHIESFPSTLTRILIWENELVTLPVLPSSLEWLVCYENELTSLPPIPNGTIEIACSNNQLTGLPALPNSLEKLLCGVNPQMGAMPALPTSMHTLECNTCGLNALPALPNGLQSLNCHNNNMTSLPALPSSLRSLTCYSNDLTALPTLPDSLDKLNCSSNPLNGLPPLPTELTWLVCHNNDLTALPALPDSLTRLECEVNNLTGLPPLPNTIDFLYCAWNPLGGLPPLPDSLRTIYCMNNDLTSLPNLPAKLRFINARENMLTSFPAMPETMDLIVVNDNPITCLPTLPDTLRGVHCDGTNINCLPNIPSNFDINASDLGFPLTVCNVNTAPCPIQQEAITGNIFYDDNGDGIKDPGESAFLNGMAIAQPGTYLTAPDLEGNYVMPIMPGTFTLDGVDVLYHNLTTNSVNITLGVLDIDSLNDIGYQAIPGIYDLVVDLTVFPARPGFDNLIAIHVENIGTESTTANIDLTFDADQSWMGSSVTPDGIIGNVASWSPMITPGTSWSSTITMNTPVSVPLGTPIDVSLTALPTMQDTTPANNSMTWNDFVVGSYDPNDKLLEPSEMTEQELQAGEYITYTIRFQNTGTYPAERVVITDTLSADLDWSSMEYISGSHDNTWFLQNGVLHFVHDPIFLPDSTNDEPNSHGYVKFRMKPVSTLMVGETIENIANIYFDFNEPVITDPAIFEVAIPTAVAEFENKGFELYPNPTNGVVNISSAKRIEQVELLQLDGRVLFSEAGNSKLHVLHTHGLAAGTYLVSLRYAGGGSNTKLLLVQ